MTGASRARALLLAGVTLVAGACRPGPALAPRVQPISMAALHQSGGVPPGWRFTPPPGYIAAGRQAFVDYGCVSCHAVQGQGFPAPADDEGHAGPDLTGMGGHHPPEYFAESILNPNAVLVDGPGYLGPDGWSRMPEYPEMPLADLADLVAYLGSLKSGGMHDMSVHEVVGSQPGGSPPAPQASLFLVQVNRVTPAELKAFDDWFGEQGMEELRATEGLVMLNAYVNRSRGKRELVTVFGFTSGRALDQFRTRARSPAGRKGFGRLLHGGQATVFHSTLLYPAVGLSFP